MRKVELYFKNENDAYSAETELNKYNVQNVVMEKIDNSENIVGDTPIFSPYGAGGGGVGGALPFSIGNSDASSEEGKAEEADPKYMSHLMQFEVDEKEYDNVISSLKKYHPYGLENN